MLPTLLLATLAAAPTADLGLGLPPLSAPVPIASVRALAPASGAPRAALRPLRDEEDDWPEQGGDEDSERHPHVLLSGWGGVGLEGGGSGRSASFWAAEAAWAFDSLDVGVEYASYHRLSEARRPWTPVLLTRVTQRFKTLRGIEAAFSLGLGAGKPSGWVGWYQVALGVRVPLGPLFLGGEIAFEQYDIIRLGGGLGVAF